MGSPSPRSPSLTFEPFTRYSSERLVREAAESGIEPPQATGDDEPHRILQMWKDRLKREAAALDFYGSQQKLESEHRNSMRFMRATQSSRAKVLYHADPTPSSTVTPKRTPTPVPREWKRPYQGQVVHPAPFVVSPGSPGAAVWAQAQSNKDFRREPLVDQLTSSGWESPEPKREEPRPAEEVAPVHLKCPLCEEAFLSAAELVHRHLDQCHRLRQATENVVLRTCGWSQDQPMDGSFALVAGLECEILTLKRDILLSEIKMEGAELADYRSSYLNTNAINLGKRISFQCPMGCFCIGNDTSVPFTEIAIHAAQCWEISVRSQGFSKAQVGNSVRLGSLLTPAAACDSAAILKITVADAIRAAVPELAPFIQKETHPLASRGNKTLCILRTRDDQPVSLNSPVVHCWCADFTICFT